MEHSGRLYAIGNKSYNSHEKICFPADCSGYYLTRDARCMRLKHGGYEEHSYKHTQSRCHTYFASADITDHWWNRAIYQTSQPAATEVAAPTGTTQTAQTPPTVGPTQAPIASTEQPVAPEQNPVGDIPDTQAFVKYVSSAGGYELDAPEGWSRTESGPNVSFIDKLNGEMVTITDASSAPNASSARTNQVAELQRTGRAVQVTNVKDVQLPSGPIVLVEYTSTRAEPGHG